MRMRRSAFALLATLLPALAHAQQQNQNPQPSPQLPAGVRVEKDVPYKTAKGTNLTAHVFTAVAPADTLLAGTYSVTVVDYSSALSELPMAMQEAAATMRAMELRDRFANSGECTDTIVEEPVQSRVYSPS